MSKGRILAAAVLIALGIAVGFVVLRAGKPIHMGFIGDLTGKFADLGKTCRDGALMAVEQINAAGGIDGRKLRMTIMDEGAADMDAVEAIRQLAEQNVSVSIGPFTSAAAKNALAHLNEAGLLSVGPVVAGDYMAGKDDYFIKLFPSTALFGSSLAELASEEYGVGNAVVIFDEHNSAYSTPIIEEFARVLERSGGTVQANIAFDSSRNGDYSAIARQAAAYKPDGILLVTSSLSAAMIAQHLRKQGSEATFFSSAWAASNELIANGGSAVEGMLFYIPYDQNLDDPGFQTFVRRFEDRFFYEPTFCSAFNYDAVMMVAEALRQDSWAKGLELRDIILKIGSFKGCQKRFEVDENGDAHRDLILQTVRDGEFVTIERQ